MEFSTTISYDTQNEHITIKLDLGKENTTENQIIIPKDLYMPFILALVATGRDMQSKGIDVGFEEDGGINE